MIAERVVSELTKRHDLPESLVKLIFLLMAKEEEDGFPAIRRGTSEPPVGDPGPLIVPYVHAFHSILKRLPKIYEAGEDGQFTGSIRVLLGDPPFTLYLIFESGFTSYTLSEKNFEKTYSRTSPMIEMLLDFRVSFEIPRTLRFRHTHILGTNGSGKSTLIQRLVRDDIRTDAAIVVMAPKGNMLDNIAAWSDLDPARLVYIRPEDNVGINLFDIGRKVDESEEVHAAELIKYIFSSIVLSEMRDRQDTLFSACIALLFNYPNGSMRDFRTILESKELPEKYWPYVRESEDKFFRNQFPTGGEAGYSKTKQEVAWRLDAFEKHPVIRRTFNATETTVNLARAVNEGKVILIDNSIKHYGLDGAAFFGRFIVALVDMIMMRRDTKTKLRPLYFYIDEAQLVIDDRIEGMLDRAREAKVGLTLAHQRLKQLDKYSTSARDAVIAEPAIKFIGVCDENDAKVFANKLQVKAEVLFRQSPYNWHLYLNDPSFRNTLSFYNREPKYLARSPAEMAAVLEQNRARYAVDTPTTPKSTPRTPHTTPPAPDDDIEALNTLHLPTSHTRR